MYVCLSVCVLITQQITLQETSSISAALKCQLKDLGQQLVVLTGERDRNGKENGKLRGDNQRMCGEQNLLIAKVSHFP